MASSNLLVLIHFSVLLLTCFSALAYNNDDASLAQSPHYTHPSEPPVVAPEPYHHPKPPMQSPAKAPTTPLKHHHKRPKVKKVVAIQGVVYCKSCKYIGVDTLTDATPLVNASVKIVCAGSKYQMVHQATTDKNGYFFMMPPKLTTGGVHLCKVSLAKSPLAKCSVPTNLHNGLNGAILIRPPPPAKPPTKPPPPPPYKFALFTVGPFATMHLRNAINQSTMIFPLDILIYLIM